MSGTLLFCVGSMTIMGALQSGLENQHTIYYTKSVLDFANSLSFGLLMAITGLCIFLIYIITH